MTDRPAGGTWRPDLDNDDDMRKLVESGYIWSGGPKTQQKAIDAIQRHPEWDLSETPQEIIDLIDPEFGEAEPDMTQLSTISDSEAPMLDPGNGELL